MRNSVKLWGPAARFAAVAALAVALGGCSSMDDMFGTPSPARDSTGAHPMAQNDKDQADKGTQTAKSEAAKPDQDQPEEKESGGFFDRMFGSVFGTPSPPRDTTGAHPMAESKTVPGEDKPYPNVGTTPARPAVSPAEERQKMVQGLVADRTDARYTDQALRREEPQPRSEPAPQAQPQPEKPAQPQAQMQPPPMPERAPSPVPMPSAAPPAPVPAPPQQTAALPDQVPAAPPPQPESPPMVTSMAPIPNPPLGGEKQAAPENPAAGTAGATFGPPPPDIDIAQNQFASAGPARVDGEDVAGSSFRVATVHFGAGSAKLDGRDDRALRRVVTLYKQQGGQVTVVGHSSSYTRNMNAVRHQIVNFSLSLERAQAVARALRRMGVPQDAIQVAALSDSQPVYYESMPAGEAANRRAEVFLRR